MPWKRLGAVLPPLSAWHAFAETSTNIPASPAVHSVYRSRSPILPYSHTLVTIPEYILNNKHSDNNQLPTVPYSSFSSFLSIFICFWLACFVSSVQLFYCFRCFYSFTCFRFLFFLYLYLFVSAFYLVLVLSLFTPLFFPCSRPCSYPCCYCHFVVQFVVQLVFQFVVQFVVYSLYQPSSNTKQPLATTTLKSRIVSHIIPFLYYFISHCIPL